MSLDTVLAISGKPGLYKMLTRTRNGIVAESLLDKKKIGVNIHNNISVLSEIAIYTLTEEVPLKDVFKNIYEKEGGKATSINHKASNLELEEYFFEVLPDYDEDRVYASDIKKVIQWYNLLLDHDLLDLEDEAVDDESEATSNVASDEEE